MPYPRLPLLFVLFGLAHGSARADYVPDGDDGIAISVTSTHVIIDGYSGQSWGPRYDQVPFEYLNASRRAIEQSSQISTATRSEGLALLDGPHIPASWTKISDSRTITLGSTTLWIETSTEYLDVTPPPGGHTNFVRSQSIRFTLPRSGGGVVANPLRLTLTATTASLVAQ